MKYIIAILIFINTYASQISYQFSNKSFQELKESEWIEYLKPIESSETNDVLYFKIKTSILGENNLLFIDVLSPGIINIYDENHSIIYQYGQKRPDVKGSNSIFPVFKLESNKLYYITRTSIVRFDDKLSFISQNDLNSMTLFGNNVSFLFLGSFFFMLLFHFGNLVITKNKSFLYYISFNFFYAILVFSCSLQFHNLIGTTFFEENIMMFSAFASIFMHYFAFSFLNLNSLINKKTVKVMSFFKYALFIMGFSYLFMPDNIKIILNLAIDFLINISIIGFLFLAIKIRKKQPMSIFYLYSWAPIFISIILIYCSQMFGIFSGTFYIRYVLMFGCLLEMVINSFGLAYKNKITEEEKIKAEIEAKDKKRYQNLFRVVSHDISTPVATAQGWAEELEASHIKEKIIQSLKKTCEIIDQVKIEEKRSNITSTKTFTTDVYNELRKMQEFNLSNKNIKFSYKGLPIALNINSGILTNSILNNILNNSIKFSKDSSKIIMSSYEENNKVIISIEDFGIGMSKEKVHEILNNTTISTRGTNGEKGTGLGIEIVKSYMDEFEAEMKIKSETGLGTTFFLIFNKNSINK